MKSLVFDMLFWSNDFIFKWKYMVGNNGLGLDVKRKGRMGILDMGFVYIEVILVIKRRNVFLIGYMVIKKIF